VDPVTRYAKSGTVHIAYQVVGEGGRDVMFVPGWASHIEMAWAFPPYARLMKRVASFARLIIFDKRGTGLSDPVISTPTLEERMEDLLSVMDAAGSERATLFGECEGAPLSVLFAAAHPERTDGLLLYGAMPAIGRDETGAMWIDETYDDIEKVISHWGEGRTLEIFAPSVAGDERARRSQGRYERASASPGMACAMLESLRGIDVGPVAATIHVPTVVMHRRGDFVPIEPARLLADRIPGARFVELEGADHALLVGDTRPVIEEIEEFVTGVRAPREPDRALLTILFTDIVGSTELAASLGDASWRELLAEHDRVVRRQLEDHGGREVKTVGDGFLATFDGPARAIWCARAITNAVRRLGIEVRAGIHTGETELLDGDIGGMAVHIGARVAALAEAGEVLVTRTVRDLVAGSGIEFADRGPHDLKGVPGSWGVLAVGADHVRPRVKGGPAGDGRELEPAPAAALT
jgi:class 3 adenylate cyclase